MLEYLHVPIPWAKTPSQRKTISNHYVEIRCHHFDEMRSTHHSLDSVNSKAFAENLDIGQNRYKRKEM